ncbi:hypothetical protein [Megamonas funiformis]
MFSCHHIRSNYFIRICRCSNNWNSI